MYLKTNSWNFKQLDCLVVESFYSSMSYVLLVFCKTMLCLKNIIFRGGSWSFLIELFNVNNLSIDSASNPQNHFHGRSQGFTSGVNLLNHKLWQRYISYFIKTANVALNYDSNLCFVNFLHFLLFSTRLGFLSFQRVCAALFLHDQKRTLTTKEFETLLELQHTVLCNKRH